MNLRRLCPLTPLAALAAASGVGYLGVVSGAITVDLGIGRRTRPLRSLAVDVAANREIVFDVLAEPYQVQAARQGRVRVWERGRDMVLAAHHTKVGGALTARTVETVRLTRPERIDFRLVRGPVPYAAETFLLTENGAHTRVTYDGQLGTDLWAIGARWGALVARHWEAAVTTTLTDAKTRAEQRGETSAARRSPRTDRAR